MRQSIRDNVGDPHLWTLYPKTAEVCGGQVLCRNCTSKEHQLVAILVPSPHSINKRPFEIIKVLLQGKNKKHFLEEGRKEERKKESKEGRKEGGKKDTCH